LGSDFPPRFLAEESFAKECAGDRLAVGVTDACTPHGWPPSVPHSLNDVIKYRCRFFFGKHTTQAGNADIAAQPVEYVYNGIDFTVIMV